MGALATPDITGATQFMLPSISFTKIQRNLGVICPFYAIFYANQVTEPKIVVKAYAILRFLSQFFY